MTILLCCISDISWYVLLHFHYSSWFIDSTTDLINIVTVTVFGVVHRFSDGFTYGQPFWMTVCSPLHHLSQIATLLWDLYRTPDFNKMWYGCPVHRQDK